MEASGAVGNGAGGDAGQAQSGDNVGSGESQGADYGAILEQTQQLSSGMEEMRQFLMSEPWARQMEQQQPQEPQQQEQYPDLDLSQLGLDTGDPQTDQQLAQNLMAMVDQVAQQRIDAGVKQHVQPLAQQFADMQQEQSAERLANKYPEMQQPETAERVIDMAHQLAERMGRPDLAGDPQFWELAYLAGRAIDSAQDEGDEAPKAAHLEGGGGAGAAGVSQADFLQQISGADSKLGAKVLPF